MLVDLKEVWKAGSAREFCKTPFSNGGRWPGQRWLARMRREGVRRAGFCARLVSYPTDLDWGSEAVG